jgi:hypothetical protein
MAPIAMAARDVRRVEYRRTPSCVAAITSAGRRKHQRGLPVLIAAPAGSGGIDSSTVLPEPFLRRRHTPYFRRWRLTAWFVTQAVAPGYSVDLAVS